MPRPLGNWPKWRCDDEASVKPRSSVPSPMGPTGGKQFIDLYRPDAVRILDFPHAAEHLNLLLEALQQAGMTLPPNAFDRCFHILKHRGPGLLLGCYDRLPPAYKELEVV